MYIVLISEFKSKGDKTLECLVHGAWYPSCCRNLQLSLGTKYLPNFSLKNSFKLYLQDITHSENQIQHRFDSLWFSCHHRHSSGGKRFPGSHFKKELLFRTYSLCNQHLDQLQKFFTLFGLSDTICSMQSLKEHWVEFTQETSLNGWYFIGKLEIAFEPASAFHNLQPL